MLLEILAVLCTLRIVFGIPVPVRLADSDGSPAVKEADIPQLQNGSSLNTITPGPAIPDTLDIPTKQPENPGPVVPDTLDIPIEEASGHTDAAKAMPANTTGPFIPIPMPDTPVSQEAINESTLMDILTRIANANNSGPVANASLTSLLTNSTAEQAARNKEALLRELLAATNNTTTSSGEDKDNTSLMALLIDADTTSDEANLMALLADVETREEADRLMALANAPGPILPRDAPATPPAGITSDEAMMAFLAHASRSSSSLFSPQDAASGKVNTTQLIASTLDEARAKGRNPLGRTWEQLLEARDEKGDDVPIVLVGMEVCEERMKRVVRRDGEGEGEGAMGKGKGEIAEQGIEKGKDKMNQTGGEMGEMGNWWCF